MKYLFMKLFKIKCFAKVSRLAKELLNELRDHEP